MQDWKIIRNWEAEHGQVLYLLKGCRTMPEALEQKLSEIKRPTEVRPLFSRVANKEQAVIRICYKPRGSFLTGPLTNLPIEGSAGCY